MFYERSESLVGICKDVGSNSSRTLTLDLTQYDQSSTTTTTTKGKKARRAVSDGGGGGKKRRLVAASPAGTVATQ